MTSDEPLHRDSDPNEDDGKKYEQIPPSERALSPRLGQVSDVMPQISKQTLDSDKHPLDSHRSKREQDRALIEWVRSRNLR